MLPTDMKITNHCARIIARTDTTVLLKWDAPPAFNIEITSFHLQYCIGRSMEWTPPDGISIAPMLRFKEITNLMPATPYLFRLRAENRMGLGPWGLPSELVRVYH